VYNRHLTETGLLGFFEIQKIDLAMSDRSLKLLLGRGGGASVNTGNAFARRDSSVGTATRYWAGRSGDRIPVRAMFFAPVQTGSGTHPACYKMVTGLFPGVKRPERVFDHPPLSSTKVEERGRLDRFVSVPYLY
jgi:hypothetical protein